MKSGKNSPVFLQVLSDDEEDAEVVVEGDDTGLAVSHASSVPARARFARAIILDKRRQTTMAESFVPARRPTVAESLSKAILSRASEFATDGRSKSLKRSSTRKNLSSRKSSARGSGSPFLPGKGQGRVSILTFQKMLRGDADINSTAEAHGGGTGLMTDYLIRLKTPVSGFLGKSFKLLLGPSMLSRHTVENLGAEGTPIRSIAELISAERLHQNLWDDLVVFWKSQETQGWMRTSKHVTLAASRRLVKMTRMACCLRDEVDNWLAARSMLKRGRDAEVINRLEDQVERYTRLQEFWTQAHMDSRKIPPQVLTRSSRAVSRKSSLVSSDGDGLPPALHSLPGLLRPPSQSGDSRPQSVSRPPSRLLAARPGSRSSSCSGSGDVTRNFWKTRPQRSQCSFGGWDWSQGSPEVERSTKPSTPSRRDIRKDVIAGVEPPYWRDDDDEEDKSVPIGKWWSRGSDLSGFLKPKHVKSASLPNLRIGGSHTMTHDLWANENGGRSPSSPSGSSLKYKTFTEPWKSNDPNLKWMNAPSQQYLRACQKNRKSPKLLPFVTGHSSKLEAGGKGLLDGDLSAITKMNRDVQVAEVELQDNVLLTESSLVPFTESLFGKDLQKLNLRRCVQVGDAMLQTLGELVSSPQGVPWLTSLDLSCIPISSKFHLPVCRAIEAHTSLQVVHLAETGIGGNRSVKECIGALFGCKTLRALNLGWNCFTAEAFDHLGKCCVQAQTLTSLDLANCSAVTEESDITPIVFLLEHLKHDSRLTHLDISVNRLDYRGALIVEDALLHHGRVKELNMAENPMGLLGMRSLLRLLACDESGLVYFRCEGCATGAHPHNEDNFYNATNPGGRYRLDLAHPYSRSLLRMLYRTCQRLRISSEAALTDIHYSERAYSVQHDPATNSWIVPDRGRLYVTFSMERATEGTMKDIDENDFGGVVQTHQSVMRRQPGFKKVIPICAQWKTLEGRVQEQLAFSNALSKDFLLTYPQIQEFSRCREMCAELLLKLMPCIIGGEASVYLAAMHTPTIGEQIRLLQRAKCFLDFSVENPTGHYKLDLANPADYAVAERLMLIDRWEAGIGIRHSRPDTSQKGNRSQVRNETYQGNAVEGSITKWTLPDYDLLEFDYCSSKRPPLQAPTLDEITFTNILKVLQQSEVSMTISEASNPAHASKLVTDEAVQTVELEAIRKVSHLINIRAKQLRSMLGIFSKSSTRVQVCVLFFNRITDMHNEKVFRVRLEENESRSLCDKIGYVTYFPFIQPEQVSVSYDFSNHEERLATNLLILLTTKERRENTRDVHFIREDGTEDPLPLGVPRSWESFEKMPKAGVFKCTYSCSPEDRRFNVRKDMFQKYGGWSCDIIQDHVDWWCDIRQTPQDVLEFLTFLVRHFSSIQKAFIFIDGVDGNRVVSRGEFQEGLDRMEFHKFDKKRSKHDREKSERIKDLFRYLDPSGEGQVSQSEWDVLNLLWREVQLSIREFVSFLERTLGEDMTEAWEFFDEDGSGEIDEDEWQVATRNVGYFGPVMPIFHFLDKDGEGSISSDEFILLEDFQDEEGSDKASTR